MTNAGRGAESENRAIALFGATGRTGAWIGLRALRRGIAEAEEPGPR